MSLIYAVLMAQAGPIVSPGAAGAMPMATLPIPRRKPADAPGIVAAPPSRLGQCLARVRSAPLEAIAAADDWLRVVKGAPLADPAYCKALALGTLERWSEAEAAFVLARDALPAGEKVRRAQLGAAAGIAADAAGNRERGLALLDTAHAEALSAADSVTAGKIALDRAGPLAALGRKAEAGAALAEARAALPDSADVWLISARFARQQRSLTEAQAQIETAARIDPRDPAIGLEAGVIAVLGGRDEAARRSWQSVIAAAPDAAEAKTAKTYLDQLGPASTSP